MCGTIVEFEDDVIELEQKRVAKLYGYELLMHRHELYGICPKCRASNAPSHPMRRM